MINYPPVINSHNSAYAAGFTAIKGKVKEIVLKLLKDESLKGYSFNQTLLLQKYMAAQLLIHFIYLKTVNPYIIVTMEEAKEQVGYETLKDCFGCNKIDLDIIIDSYGFDDP